MAFRLPAGRNTSEGISWQYAKGERYCFRAPKLATKPLEKQNVLVASEDALVNACVVDALDSNIFTIRFADCLSKFLLLTLETKVDLIILDIDLPGKSAVDLIKIVMNIRPKTPLIVTSSDCSFETGQEIAKLGIWSYLPKPIDTKELRRFLNHYT